MRNERAVSVPSPSALALLIVFYAVTTAAAGLAVAEVEHVPPAQGSRLMDCVRSLLQTKGCVEDILDALETENPRLGPQCCKAIVGIDKFCWPQVLLWLPLNPLPFNPVLPAIIMSFCSGYNQSSSAAP